MGGASRRPSGNGATLGRRQSLALRHVRQLTKGLLARVTSPDMTADSDTPVNVNRARIQVHKALILGRRAAFSKVGAMPVLTPETRCCFRSRDLSRMGIPLRRSLPGS